MYKHLVLACWMVYLGQHFLTDVVAGFGLSYFFYRLLRVLEHKIELLNLKVFWVTIPILCWMMFLMPGKVLFVAAAGIFSLTLGHHMQEKWINFDVTGSARAQVSKFIVGFLGVLLMKEGLKKILPYSSVNAEIVEASFVQLNLWLDFVRYFALCSWITFGAPAIFQTFFRKPSKNKI